MPDSRIHTYTKKNAGLCLKLENVIMEASTAGQIAAQEYVEPTFSTARNVEAGYPVVKVFCPTPRFREALEQLRSEAVPSDLKWTVINFDYLEGAMEEARRYACEAACTILDISFPNEVFLIEPCTAQLSILHRQPSHRKPLEKAAVFLDDLY